MKKTISYISLALFLLLGLACNKQNSEAVLEDTTPRVTDIVPEVGVSGGVAIISGRNFSEKIEENSVLVDGKAAVISSCSKNRIYITLPVHADGDVKVDVFVRGTKVRTLDFAYGTIPVKELTITSVNPARGLAGQDVVVYGDGFASDKSEMLVTFNGVPAEVKYSNANALTVVAPEIGTVGDVDVVISRGVNSVKTTFHYSAFVILSNEPKEGMEGTVVTIKGDGFSAVPSENVVYIGGISVPVKSATESELQISIPSLLPGTYKFTVEVAGKSTTGGSFKVQAAWSVLTLVGNGTSGCADGVGTAAVIAIPQEISMAKDGRIWFTQRGGAGKDAVRSLNAATNEVTTIVPASNSLVSGGHPWAGCFDSDGNFFFPCKATGKVIKVTPDGVASQLAMPSHTLTTNAMQILFDDGGWMYLLNRGSDSYISIWDISGTPELISECKVKGLVEHMAWINDDKSQMIIGFADKPFGLALLDPSDANSYVHIAGVTDTKPNAANFSDGEEGKPETAVIGVVEGIVKRGNVIYFSDVTTYTIRCLTADSAGNFAKGTVSTFAGQNFAHTKLDGLASEAKFVYPNGLLFLNDDSILVADGTGSTIRKIYR